MKLILVSVFFLLFFVSKAQNTTLRVLGQYSYIERSETNGVILRINNEDIDEKKELLLNKIDSLGIKSNLTKIDRSQNFQNKTSYFKIEEKDRDIFDQLLIVINGLKINIQKVYFKIPPHQLEDEYISATMAVKNANSKAKIVAHNLNYKIIKILNIDDETTYASSIYDGIDLESKKGKLLIKLLNILDNNNNLYEKESSKPYRTGGYNIWVTYHIEPK